MEIDQDLDPLMPASNVYQFVNESNRIRVLKVTFKPGDTAKTHHHPAHMAYELKGGKLRLIAECNTQDLDLKKGSAVFLDEQNYEATTKGKTMVELIVVELKQQLNRFNST